jgi:hypothetical protein
MKAWIGSYERENVFLDVMRNNFWHLWGRGEGHTGFWWGKLRERDHLEDLGIERRILLKYIFSK